MPSPDKPLRILHSFPHRLGMGRICTTAWYEIDSTAAMGADLIAIAGDSVRPFHRPVCVKKTFSWGKLTIPYRILGTRRMCILHDKIVARMLPGLRDQIDIIHAWPSGALQTIRAAKKLGIPVALERCNAHTRFAYEVVRDESNRIGVRLPDGFEHSFDQATLQLEETEFAEADALLCPSDFVVKTFAERGFSNDRLIRFIYGVDEKKFFPDPNPKPADRKFRMIFVGVAAVRKGLHFALEAWLNSPASRSGEFWIVGEFLPEYREKLTPMLAHPSIKVFGHRDDVPKLMRESDVLVFPSIEEGFGLVVTEAMASGCVPLISDACTDLCQNGRNGFVHRAKDVSTLCRNITDLFENPSLLNGLRTQAIVDTSTFTWAAAGNSLISAYRKIIQQYRSAPKRI